MFNPKYRALLTVECFPGESFICLGTQLISIVEFLKNLSSSHIWLGADVDAVGKNATKLDINSFQLNRIGADFDFIQYCAGIEQFIWGTFLCVDSVFSTQNIQHIELGTEDFPFRSIAIDGILIEIRTFDTSFFEIYSEDKKIIDTISEKFKSCEITSLA